MCQKSFHVNFKGFYVFHLRGWNHFGRIVSAAIPPSVLAHLYYVTTVFGQLGLMFYKFS